MKFFELEVPKRIRVVNINNFLKSNYQQSHSKWVIQHLITNPKGIMTTGLPHFNLIKFVGYKLLSCKIKLKKDNTIKSLNNLTHKIINEMKHKLQNYIYKVIPMPDIDAEPTITLNCSLLLCPLSMGGCDFNNKREKCIYSMMFPGFEGLNYWPSI